MRAVSPWLLLAAGFGSAAALGIEKRDEFPVAQDFLRWPFPATIVLGDYVYIHGGEISRLFDGVDTYENEIGYASLRANSTYSISLKEAWRTNDVAVIEAATAPSHLNRQFLWRTADGEGFIPWGGNTYYLARPPRLEIWEFSPLGNGEGSWETKRPDDPDAFSSMKRPLGGVGRQPPTGNLAYYFGGGPTSDSDRSVGADVVGSSPGIIEFNTETFAIRNISSEGFGRYGTMWKGGMEWVPFASEMGMLLMLGGWESPVDRERQEFFDLSTVWLWDAERETFSEQKTTSVGQMPRSLQDFCTVGVQGPNGTYEIFIYGGSSGQETFSTVWVLSLPGFVFFAVDIDDSTRRMDHSCVMVNSRQMLSVGGTVGTLGWPDSLRDPDPWPRGLRLLDLTSMTWGTEFMLAAGEYESPDMVREWYAGGGLDEVEWANEDVEAIFLGLERPPSGSQTGDETADSPSGDDTPGRNSPDRSSSSGQTPAAAIAGGVVGGIALVAILVVAFFFLRHRRAKRRKHGNSQAVSELQASMAAAAQPLVQYKGSVSPYSYPSPYKAASGTWGGEMYAQHGYSELQSSRPPQELQGSMGFAGARAG